MAVCLNGALISWNTRQMAGLGFSLVIVATYCIINVVVLNSHVSSLFTPEVNN